MSALLSRFRPLLRFFHSTCIRQCEPEFLPDAPKLPMPKWPLDPRGEEIRTAKARRLGIHVAPRKLNLVAKLVRNLRVEEARRQLAGCKKKTAPVAMATINAAVTNARAFNLREDRLVISHAFVGKGKYLKRIRPWHGKGRFGIEDRKYAHLTIILRELDEELWEATVLPQYIHFRRGRNSNDDRLHAIHSSSNVSWVSDVDSSYEKTKEAVKGLKIALEHSRNPIHPSLKA